MRIWDKAEPVPNELATFDWIRWARRVCADRLRRPDRALRSPGRPLAAQRDCRDGLLPLRLHFADRRSGERRLVRLRFQDPGLARLPQVRGLGHGRQRGRRLLRRRPRTTGRTGPASTLWTGAPCWPGRRPASRTRACSAVRLRCPGPHAGRPGRPRAPARRSAGDHHAPPRHRDPRRARRRRPTCWRCGCSTWTGRSRQHDADPGPGIDVAEFDSTSAELEVGAAASRSRDSGVDSDPAARSRSCTACSTTTTATSRRWWATSTVDVDGTDHGGIRWFELRRPTGGDWALHQEGTYAIDEDHRWMGSVAMDRTRQHRAGLQRRLLAAYPSLRYTGRMARRLPGCDDPAGDGAPRRADIQHAIYPLGGLRGDEPGPGGRLHLLVHRDGHAGD